MGRGVEAGNWVDGGRPIVRQRSLARDGVGGGATSMVEAESVAGWCPAPGRVGGGGRERRHEWWSRVSGLIGTGPIRGRAGVGPTRLGPAVSDSGLSAGTDGGGGTKKEFKVECNVRRAGREK
jgi:hypothetical protein